MTECAKKRKIRIPTELVNELVAALRFDVRWAIVRVSAAFDIFVLKKQNAFIIAKKQRTLNSGKSAMFAFVSSNCDENSLRLQFGTLQHFLMLHGVAGLQSVSDPFTVPTFKNSFDALLPQLSSQLKEHFGLFLNYYVASLNAQIAATKSRLSADYAKMLENLKAGKPPETISDGRSQYADVGLLHKVHDGKLNSAKKKLFAFVDTCCTNDALLLHIDTLAKSFGKDISAKRSDGLESGALLSPSVFNESMAQLIAEHCASEEKADSFGNFLDTFVCSLLGQRQWFIKKTFPEFPQYLASFAQSVHEHQGSSGGQSSSNSSVVEQQQNELSDVSGVPPAQLERKRGSTAEPSQKTAKKGKGETQ